MPRFQADDRSEQRFVAAVKPQCFRLRFLAANAQVKLRLAGHHRFDVEPAEQAGVERAAVKQIDRIRRVRLSRGRGENGACDACRSASEPLVHLHRAHGVSFPGRHGERHRHACRRTRFAHAGTRRRADIRGEITRSLKSALQHGPGGFHGHFTERPGFQRPRALFRIIVDRRCISRKFNDSKYRANPLSERDFDVHRALVRRRDEHGRRRHRFQEPLRLQVPHHQFRSSPQVRLDEWQRLPAPAPHRRPPPLAFARRPQQEVLQFIGRHSLGALDSYFADLPTPPLLHIEPDDPVVNRPIDDRLCVAELQVSATQKKGKIVRQRCRNPAVPCQRQLVLHHARGIGGGRLPHPAQFDSHAPNRDPARLLGRAGRAHFRRGHVMRGHAPRGRHPRRGPWQKPDQTSHRAFHRNRIK